jgi:hypothetical protein
MRPLFTRLCKIMLALNLLPMLVLIGPVYGASITSGYPGYPGVWNGLTTNTIMLINLDTRVSMIGTQPDMTYCVKKLSFSGFDYVLTDVTCDVAAADDRLSVSLYPQALLETNSPNAPIYAYKIANINFEGGSSEQNFNQCYLTGNNPIIPPAYAVDESVQCTDYNYIGGFNGISGGNYCFKCHVGGYTKLLPWDLSGYPLPVCTP